VRLTGLRGGAKATLAARLIAEHPGSSVLWVAATSAGAGRAFEDLRTVLGLPEERSTEESNPIRLFPSYDTPPFDRFSPQPFVVVQRMGTLYTWLTAAGEPRRQRPQLTVCPAHALLLPVPTPEWMRTHTVHFEIGQHFDRDTMLARLVKNGYARMPLVEEPGEVSARGDILDVYPPHETSPVRIELFGDEIESIRRFDPITQRSQQSLAHIVAPPPRDLVPQRERIIACQTELRAHAAAQGVSEADCSALVDALLRGHLPPGVEAIAPILRSKNARALDFLPEDALILLDETAQIELQLAQFFDQAHAQAEAARGAGRLICPPGDAFVDPTQLRTALAARRAVRFEALDVVDPDDPAERIVFSSADQTDLRRALLQARRSEHPLKPLVERLEHYRELGWRVALAAPTLSGATRLHDLLEAYGLSLRLRADPRPIEAWSVPGVIELCKARLSSGFEFPERGLAVITEEEIFGMRERRRATKRGREGEVISGLAQLTKGDPVVHSVHGIGLYQGLVTLHFGKATGDFLEVLYDGGDRFFLPVDLLNRIQRYVGVDGHVPRVDKLGGGTWNKAKRSVERSVRRMAEELLAIHAARELASGFAFSGRDLQLEEFEATFPYEETPDQLTAIDDVLADLSRPKPMDRLVCGDVGYGKTEVAIRAAFRAVMDGKQVALLVPTTVLAKQHEETFCKRFENFPVVIEALSRLTSPKQTRRTLEGLASGRVDIVIGTHRLLQKNVHFHDLGLLIVDEEQRFGVRHKERIKQRRKEVDVLTLTATPIPRTLQQALTGIRDLSLIDTPPADRIAIRTQVCKPSDALIREAILREVQRGGQVYYIHNRVRSIHTLAVKLRELVPEVRLVVAHGQMRERELEEHVLAFLHGEADVLLATTIVENGLDLPRANTIFIDRADRMGLAQLYQLRGRVGRSSQRAYAYLLIPGEEALSRDALRRVQAIQDLSDVGSGFRLAAMDLEIRGAGDLLGAEQSGKLAAVGYETYMEMLQATIDAMRGKLHTPEVDPEIRLPVNARLDANYVPNESQRLVLYKRLASAADDSEVAQIRDEILDCYGSMPPEAEHLLEVIRLKLRARRLGISAIGVERNTLVLTAAPTTRIDPQQLVELLNRPGSGIRVAPGHKILRALPHAGPEELFTALFELLENLAARSDGPQGCIAPGRQLH